MTDISKTVIFHYLGEKNSQNLLVIHPRILRDVGNEERENTSENDFLFCGRLIFKHFKSQTHC